MSKCNTCRKADVLDSRWDKIRLRLFHIFHKDIIDLSQDKYTQGFGDGYKVGHTHGAEAAKKTLDEHKSLLEEQTAPPPEFTEFPLLINMEKVMTVSSNGKLFLNKEPVNKEKLDRLKTDAIMFGNSLLWEIITNTLASQAEAIGWKSSKDLQDLYNAKMMVRTIDLQRQIIKKIQDAT